MVREAWSEQSDLVSGFWSAANQACKQAKHKPQGLTATRSPTGEVTCVWYVPEVTSVFDF